ncbi:hypothetical protein JW848_01870 [Candidatus Bipolaricaulota bacterium]|nr:hypothetical protein [Candidatus Bipolaricaulota bacterium]
MRDRWRRWVVGLAMVCLVGIGIQAADDHGNSPLSATPILVGEGWEDGCIETAGDADYYMFRVESGRSYRLQVDSLAEISDPVVYLFGEDGLRIVDVDDNGGGGSSALVRWTSDVSGTWFAMVRQASALSGTGCYRLTLSAEASDDHGDTILEATPVDRDGTWMIGAIETASDCDVFVVTVSRGYLYSVDLRPRGGSDALSAVIVDSDGRLIEQQVDIVGSEGATLESTADLSGPWFVSVCAASGGEGGYELRVLQEGYGDLHGNRAADATPISADSGTVEGVLEVAVDEDWFSLSTQSGASYAISVAVPGVETPGGGAVVALRSSSGSLLLPEMAITGGGRTDVTWDAVEEDTLFLQIRPRSASAPVLYRLDVRAVLGMELLSSFNPQGYTLDADGDEGTAYFVVGTKGLIVLDVSDPGRPKEIGGHTTRGYAQAVDVVDGIAYVASRGDGIVLIDVSDPTRPSELGTFDTGGSSRDVHVVGGVAFVADQRGGVQVVDVSDPSTPVLIGSWATRGFAEQIEISGDLAAVAAGDAGIELLDISAPGHPVLLGSLETPGEARGVVIAGSIVYVAMGYRGIAVVDLSDTSAPRLETTVPVDGEVQSLALADGGRILLAAADAGGVAAFELGDPHHPVPQSVLDTPGHAVSVHVAGTLIYVADLEEGLVIGSLYPRT